MRSWLARRKPMGLDPDDIIQEAYAILADLDRVDGIAFPRAYLFQVARSVVSRQLRRARVVPIHAIEDVTQLEHADDQPSPERVAIDRDELGRLARAIAAMPNKTQQAFVLRRVDGLSQREIAARMAISENTVEKHISRGLRFLINWFGEGGKALAEVSRKTELEMPFLDDQTRNQSRH